MSEWEEFPAAADLPPPLPAGGSSWDEFKPVQQAAPATQASGWDEFKAVEQAKPKPPEAEGYLSTFAREFAHAAPGAVVGTGVGLAAGAAGGTIAGLPGTIIGGLVGGIGGGVLGEKVKEMGLGAAGYDDAAQRKANEEANPWLSAGGRAAAVVLGFGRGAVMPIAKEATTLAAKYGPEVAARAGSAAIGGGFETGRQLVQEGKISSVPDIALQTAAGAIWNKPRAWAEPFEQAGANLGARIRPPPVAPREPIAPAAEPPAQGEFAFSADKTPLPPDRGATAPPPDVQAGLFGEEGARLTPAEQTRLGQLQEQTTSLTPQEVTEYRALSRREVGTEGRPEQPWQPELPLEPPPTYNPSTRQHGMPLTEGQHQRELPLEGGAGVVPHGSAGPEASGGTAEVQVPPAKGEPPNPQNAPTEAETRGYAKPLRPQVEEGGGVNVGQDPTLQHVFNFGKTAAPPEMPTQYGPALENKFPQIPGDVAARMARPLEQNQRTGVPSGIQQGLVEAPEGSTRLYRGENSPPGLFSTNPAEAAAYGPVRFVDVESGKIGQQFQPSRDAGKPGELVTKNPVYEQHAQPMEQRPLTEPAQRTAGPPAPPAAEPPVPPPSPASPEVNAKVAAALAPEPPVAPPITPETPPNQNFAAPKPVDKTGTETGKVQTSWGDFPDIAAAKAAITGKDTPPPTTPAEAPKRLPTDYTGKLNPDISASEYVTRMTEMRAEKPRPIDKLWKDPSKAPPAEVAAQQARIKAWNSEYRQVTRNQKEALARDNTIFKAKQENRELTAAELHDIGKPKEITLVRDRGIDHKIKVMDETTFSKALEKHGTREGLHNELTAFVSQAVKRIIGDMPVYTVSYGELARYKRQGAAAFYNRQQNQIIINESHLENPTMMAHAILHEGIHGVTSHALVTDKGLNHAVETIMRDVLAKAIDRPKAQTDYGFFGSDRTGKTLNAREFLAEAFSNPHFQKMLSEHSLSPETAKVLGSYLGKQSILKSAWDGIVDSVRKLLKIPTNQLSALEATMRATESSMHINEAAKGPYMESHGVSGPKDYSTTDALGKHIDTLTADEQAVLGRVAKPTGSKIPTSMAEVKNTWDKIYTAVKDDLHPLGVLVKELAAGKPLAGDTNPERLARLTRGSHERADQMLNQATFDYGTRANNGKSMREVLSPVKNDMDGFTAYAMSKRTIELEGRGIKTGVPLAEANRVAATGAQKYDPVFRELIGFQDRTLDYLQKSGILSTADVAKMRAKNKEFVPFHRQMTDEVTNNQAGSGLKVRDPLKEIEGSTREILNPIDTIIRNTHAYVALAERNRVWQSLEDLANSHPQGHKFLTPVGNVGASQTDTISLYRNGNKITYKVDPTVAAAANALNADSMNMITKIAKIPASTLRAGATLTPEFMGRNIVRDQFSAWINSKHGYVPVYDVVRNLGSMFKKDDMYQNWVKHGGANATLVSLDKQVIGMDPKTAISKATNVVTSPVRALRVASEFLENITRLGEFRRAIEKGVHPSEAAFASREVTLDFARMGSKMKALNAIIPFMNAQIEGVDRFARAIKDNPVGTMTKIAMGVTAPSVALWMSNKDDPRYKEVPQWERDLFWIIPTDKWTALSNKDADKVHKDLKRQRPDGSWEHNTGQIYKIPKPFEVGVLFGTVPERMLEAFYAKNPKAFQDLSKTVIGALTPSFIPQAASPMIEQFANRSLFTGRPLVPKYVEGVAPKEQATPYTSATAKRLGEAVSTIAPKSSFSSPIVLENYIKQWTGGLGTHALSIADKLTEKSGAPAKPTSTMADMPLFKAFAVRYPGSGAQSVQDFYKTYEERKQANVTNKMLRKSGHGDEAGQVQPQLEGIHKALGKQQQWVRDVYANPKISSQEKRQLIDTVYGQMIKAARQGNEFFSRSGG